MKESTLILIVLLLFSCQEKEAVLPLCYENTDLGTYDLSYKLIPDALLNANVLVYKNAEGSERAFNFLKKRQNFTEHQIAAVTLKKRDCDKTDRTFKLLGESILLSFVDANNEEEEISFNHFVNADSDQIESDLFFISAPDLKSYNFEINRDSKVFDEHTSEHTTFANELNLLDKTFNEVWTNRSVNLSPIYYTKAQGLIGFSDLNETLWVLDRIE